jgi:hypothetical protein
MTGCLEYVVEAGDLGPETTLAYYQIETKDVVYCCEEFLVLINWRSSPVSIRVRNVGDCL